MEAPLTTTMLPVETKVITHSHGRKCQNLRFWLCLHGQAVVEEGLIQLEQSRQKLLSTRPELTLRTWENLYPPDGPELPAC